jgi:opacity protein-like surface antigen
MKTYLAAAALALAFSASAHAEAAPDPAPKAEKKCCCEMMGRKMECCEEHRKDKGQDGHGESGAHKGHQGSH